MRHWFALLALATAAAVAPATAQNFESAYTELNLDKCKHTAGVEAEDSGFWQCRGYAGIDVRVAEGDLRMFVSFGPNADKQPAAGQTFGNFNNVDKRRIEWRMETTEGKKGTPFATILRWDIQLSDERKAKPGQALVVTRLGDAVCHVGYVDATANRDANELARKLAEERARNFDCAKDKRAVVGKKGKSVERMVELIEMDEEENKAQQQK